MHSMLNAVGRIIRLTTCFPVQDMLVAIDIRPSTYGLCKVGANMALRREIRILGSHRSSRGWWVEWRLAKSID
jgi:hypothetical protein